MKLKLCVASLCHIISSCLSRCGCGILWLQFCFVEGDSGNDVLIVVSMEIRVRIPGTNEFERKIILTAAGGATGQTTKGDGGVACLARNQEILVVPAYNLTAQKSWYFS